MRMFKLIGLVVLVGLVLMGCQDLAKDDSIHLNNFNDENNDNGVNDNGSGNTKLAIIDIANASSLAIVPVSNIGAVGRAVNGNTNKLFKITDDGYMREVSYIDENGNTMTSFSSPSAVYNATDDHVIIFFELEGYSTRKEGYLTRKSDGSVFLLESVEMPDFDFGDKTYARFQYALNSIYYISSSPSTGDSRLFVRAITKIDISNPSHLTATKIGEADYSIQNFVVNPNGHIAYSAYPMRSGTVYYRIKKFSGQLLNLPSIVSLFWIGNDGLIKYCYRANSYGDRIGTIDCDSNDVPIITVVNTYLSHSDYLLRFHDRIIVIGGDVSNIVTIVEIENQSNTPRQITISGIIIIKNAVYSSNYYYLSGYNNDNQPVLLKIDPQDDSVITLLGPEYDIRKMSVDSNDVVSFDALRMSDGKKIIGQVSSPNNVHILNESIDGEVIVLEQIK